MAMKSSEVLGVVGIVAEAFKSIYRNGKLMVLIILFPLLPYSLLTLGSLYYFKLLTTNLIMEGFHLGQDDPRSPEYFELLNRIKMDFLIFLGVEMVFLFVYSVISLVAEIATTLVSAASYSGKDMSVKDLFSGIGRMWTRPVITWFYIILLNAGYTLVFKFPICLFIVLGYRSIPLAAVGVVLVLLALSFYLYMTVDWMLGLVISVLEDGCYGLKAIGKAEELSKGRKLHGFVLNFLFMLLSNAMLLGLKVTTRPDQTFAIRTVIMLIIVYMTCLVQIFRLVAYTVFYFDCKKCHEDRVELNGGMGYSKVPTTLKGADLI